MIEFKIGDTVRYDLENGTSITGKLKKNPNKIQVFPLQLVLFHGVTMEFTTKGYYALSNSNENKLTLVESGQ